MADRFAGLCVAVIRVLPFGLSRVIPPNLLGYAVINGFTFAVDILLLTLFHGGLGWPIGWAITLGYGCAFALSFVLNRWLNFRSHAPVGRQSILFVVTVAINFGVVLLGVGAGLTALGVQYQLSRVIAGACEAVFLYCALRWVVFPRRKEPPSTVPFPDAE